MFQLWYAQHHTTALRQDEQIPVQSLFANPVSQAMLRLMFPVPLAVLDDFLPKLNIENLTKCLQSLKYMYDDLRLEGINCPNEAEFRGNLVRLNLNDGNFL